MKKRIITGILLTVFVLPFIYFGRYFMFAFVLLLSGFGVYELLNVKKKANNNPIPIYLYVISMIFSYVLIFDIPLIGSFGFDYKTGYLLSYGVNVLWLVLFSITVLSCSVFDKKLSIMDAVYIIAMVVYLSLGLKGMLYLRSCGKEDGIYLIAYVLLVTCFTDIFAYFGGMTCYKLLGNEKVHKLNERISPKKTIEGTIVGTLLGSVCGFLFAILVFKHTQLPVYDTYIYIILSLLISLFGQIGDLILSTIKRYYNIKDYSNLLPGHGGVLDRIDSLLINSMLTAIILMLL